MHDLLAQAMAGLLAANPQMAATIERDHVDDGSGHCAGCGFYRRPRWPCAVLALVRSAHGDPDPRPGVVVLMSAHGAAEVMTADTPNGPRR